MKPWMIIVLIAGLFWGVYAAYANGIAVAIPKPTETEIFEYCYSTADQFLICKIKGNNNV